MRPAIDVVALSRFGGGKQLVCKQGCKCSPRNVDTFQDFRSLNPLLLAHANADKMTSGEAIDAEKNIDEENAEEDVPQETEPFFAKSVYTVSKAQLPFGLTPKACLSVAANIISAVGLVGPCCTSGTLRES
jgi:hypothetical protein